MNLTVTSIAQERLATLIGEREADQGIRVFMQSSGGGCGGGGGACGCGGGAPRFGMGLDTATPDDAVITVGTLRFLVDPASALTLNEASIDYVEDVMQQGFSITAPNAMGAPAAGDSCGAGGCACGDH